MKLSITGGRSTGRSGVLRKMEEIAEDVLEILLFPSRSTYVLCVLPNRADPGEGPRSNDLRDISLHRKYIDCHSNLESLN